MWWRSRRSIKASAIQVTDRALHAVCLLAVDMNHNHMDYKSKNLLVRGFVFHHSGRWDRGDPVSTVVRDL